MASWLHLCTNDLSRRSNTTGLRLMRPLLNLPKAPTKKGRETVRARHTSREKEELNTPPSEDSIPINSSVCGAENNNDHEAVVYGSKAAFCSTTSMNQHALANATCTFGGCSNTNTHTDTQKKRSSFEHGTASRYLSVTAFPTRKKTAHDSNPCTILRNAHLDLSPLSRGTP